MEEYNTYPLNSCSKCLRKIPSTKYFKDQDCCDSCYINNYEPKW